MNMSSMSDFDGGWEVKEDGNLYPNTAEEVRQMAESREIEKDIISINTPDDGKPPLVKNPYINPVFDSPERKSERPPERPPERKSERPPERPPERTPERTQTNYYTRDPYKYVNLLDHGLLSLKKRESERLNKVYDTYDFDRERRLRDLWIPWISIEHDLYDRNMIEKQIEDMVKYELERNVYGVGKSNTELIKVIKDIIRINDKKYLKKNIPTKKSPAKKKSKKKSKKSPAKKKSKKKSKKSPAKKKSKKSPAKKKSKKKGK
jgi:hypothetical protein